MDSSSSQQSAVEAILKWRWPFHGLIFESGRHEIRQYMQAVDSLHQSPNVQGFDELISTAVARLTGEFHEVLSRQSRQAEYQASPISTTGWSPATDSTASAFSFRYEDYAISEPPSTSAIIYLRNIVERMNLIGKTEECIEIYKTLRRNLLRAQLERLRFEELNVGHNTRSRAWNEVRKKMELWIEVSKICVEKVFAWEKQLCEQIFDYAAGDKCFMGTVQDAAVVLFGFAEDMSLNNQTYDKIGDVLGLYDAFVWVLPHANTLFDCELGEGIRNKCAQTLSRIENQVGRMLHEFENAFLNENSDVHDDRVVVEQLTCEVMKQVHILARNKNLLTNLIKSRPLLSFGDMNIGQEALGDSGNLSFLQLRLILILAVLQENLKAKSANLETKSRSYGKASLGQLFMMNNIHHILQKIEESNELQEMIGDSCMRKLNEDFEDAKRNYETSTCNKLLSYFEDEGLYITRCFKSRPSKTAFKKRIRNFNSAFEEIRGFHCTIPDSKLREDARDAISKKLVPAYTKFLKKLESYPKMELIMKKDVKYSVEDIEV